MLLVVGMLPYILGTLLAGKLRSIVPLACVAGLVIICDALAIAGTLFSESSTGAVGLIMEPIIVSGILLFILVFTRNVDRAH
jgi:hypothetical protein